MRFLADIPDDEIQWLGALAAEQGVSRAELVRLKLEEMFSKGPFEQ